MVVYSLRSTDHGAVVRLPRLQLENALRFWDDEEADRFADHLRQRREANRYRAYPLTTDEAIELRVDARDDAFNLDDELRALANAQ